MAIANNYAGALTEEIASDRLSDQRSSDQRSSDQLDPELLRRLYALMLKCRMVEERIRILYRQGRFAGNYFAATGQEATEVGATIDLLPEDAVAPSHRNFITNIMKGTPLNLMFAHIYGRKSSPDQGRSAPAHCGYAPLNVITPSSTIAAQLSIGAGIALAYKMQRKPNVVVALTGEGATSLGFWHESVNLAAVHKLPIIFVVENNGYAESVPLSLQSAIEDLSIKAAGYGIPGQTVDGNDVVAVYTAMREAIRRARSGEGATLLETKTYRWYGHSEIDPARYRDPAEVEYWKSRDPIPAMERYLKSKQLWSDQWKGDLGAGIKREIDEAIAFAESSPKPQPDEALDHVYSFSIRDRELNRKTFDPNPQGGQSWR